MSTNKDLNRLKVVLVEKKIQPLAVQTVGMCANNCIKMVYQFVTTSAGNADEDSKTSGSGLK